MNRACLQVFIGSPLTDSNRRPLLTMEVLYQLSYVALKSNKAGVWTPGLVGSPSPCVKGRG